MKTNKYIDEKQILETYRDAADIHRLEKAGKEEGGDLVQLDEEVRSFNFFLDDGMYQIFYTKGRPHVAYKIREI